MSTLIISDLAFLEELDKQESKVSGAASAGASAGADYSDAVAASGSTTRGSIYASADGGYYNSGYDYYYGGYYSYSRGPSANVNAYDQYYYYY